MPSPEQVAALLRELERVDAMKTGFVPAHHVDHCLLRANITSPTDQNNALLLLSVDADTGRVGYAKLYPQPTSVSPPSQPDLVFQKMPQLREAFNRFDLGVTSLDQFRQELTSKLGLEETAAVKDLFRHNAFNVSFHQLVQALNRVDHVTATAAASNRPAVARTSLEEQAYYNRQRTGVFASDRADDLSMSANMASKSVHVRGHQPSRTFAEERDSQRRGGGGAKAGGELANKEAPFVLDAAAESSSALRTQIVLALRRLDEGELDATRVFLRRLEELQIPLTPTLQRLLEMQRLGNPVPFKDWMRAFEPFLAAKQQQLGETSAPAYNAKAPSPASLRRGYVRNESAQSSSSSGSVNGLLYGEGVAGFDHPTKRSFESKSNKCTDRVLLESDYSSANAPPAPAATSFLRGSIPSAVAATTRPKDFLCWSEEDEKRPPKQHAVPIRASAFATTTTDAASSIFAREQMQPVNLVRKTNSTAAAAARTPFGTEADYAASFSNPAHTFG